MKDKIRNMSRWNKFVIIIFVAIFILGCFIFKDYGVSADEPVQRQHSLVNLYYIKSVLNGEFSTNGYSLYSENSNLEKLVNKESIERRFYLYEYKYYGVTIQIPLMIIENIFNYKLDYSVIYLIRHFYTFLIFFLSLIYFYKILSKFNFKCKKLPLLGVLFLVLSPRIFGDAFYNIKDLMFMSLTIITLYYCLLYLNRPKFVNLFILALVSAITINLRFIGAIYLFLVFLFELVFLFKNGFKNSKQIIKNMLILVCLTFSIYTLITPASWNNVLCYPFEVIKFFTNYIDPISKQVHKCLYFGKQLSSKNLPWHYLPVWIFITTPLIYIITFIIGYIKSFISSVKKKHKVDINILFCNSIFTLTLLSVMIFRPIIYCGWRHFYFLYPILIINSIIGVDYLLSRGKLFKKIVISLLIINSLYIVCWMIKYHPYQYNYFSLLTRKYTVNNFNINYWHISNYDALEYILKNDNRNKITVYLNTNKNEIKANRYLLSKKDNTRLRIYSSNDLNSYDYVIIDDRKNKLNLNKYKQIYSMEMDGYKLYTIYKKN